MFKYKYIKSDVRNTENWAQMDLAKLKANICIKREVLLVQIRLLWEPMLGPIAVITMYKKTHETTENFRILKSRASASKCSLLFLTACDLKLQEERKNFKEEIYFCLRLNWQGLNAQIQSGFCPRKKKKSLSSFLERNPLRWNRHRCSNPRQSGPQIDTQLL